MPGMFCETYFVHDQKANVLTIPLETIDRHGAEATVFVVDPENIVRTRTVSLGQQDSTHIEVLAGLTEGERVISGNFSEFTPGEKVLPKVVEAGTAARAGTN
jgi:membrane fusion protein, macrolide-specific efflux system